MRTTLAEVETQKAVIEGALMQYPATVAIDADGVSLGEWATQPTLPTWGAVLPQDLAMLAAQAPVAIPVNPTGAP